MSTRRDGVAAPLLGLFVWIALALQLWLQLQHPGSLFTLTLRFFSYYTILVNLLIAVALTAPAAVPQSALARWAATTRVRSALALHIAIVGIVYSVALRSTWNPQGLQYVVDRLLHDVSPVAYVLFWATAVPKRTLAWTDAVRWLAFPLAYVAYTLVRGPWAQWYPYPFLDVTAIGYPRVWMNVAIISAAFAVLALGLVALDRTWPVRRPR